MRFGCQRCTPVQHCIVSSSLFWSFLIFISLSSFSLYGLEPWRSSNVQIERCGLSCCTETPSNVVTLCVLDVYFSFQDTELDSSPPRLTEGASGRFFF